MVIRLLILVGCAVAALILSVWVALARYELAERNRYLPAGGTVWIIQQDLYGAETKRRSATRLIGARRTYLEALEMAYSFDPAHDWWTIEHVRIGAGPGVISCHGFSAGVLYALAAERRKQIEPKT